MLLRRFCVLHVATSRWYSTAAPSSRSSPSFVEIARSSASGVGALKGDFPPSARFDSVFNSCLRLTNFDSTTGTATGTLTVSSKVCNSFGTLHGGCVATLVDIFGTLALMSKDVHRPGVSVDIHASYLNAAKKGSTIECVGRVDKIGKTLGFTSVELVDSATKKIVATGTHTKFLDQ